MLLSFAVDAALLEVLLPKVERSARYSKRRDRYLSRSDPAAHGLRPGKERQNSSWMTLTVTVIKVIGRRVVKVHRQLDKAQPEDARIEIDVGLWVTRDRGYVVNTRNAVLHTVLPLRHNPC